MKYSFFILVYLILFSSCNQVKEEDNIPTSKLEALTSLEESEDSVKTNSDRIFNKIDTTRPILIARGNEPGWYAEFFNNRVKLLLNYGKDSLTLQHNFSRIASDSSYNAIISKTTFDEDSEKSVKLSVSVLNKACNEDGSGEKREKSITLIYNGKTLNGCAYKK